MSSWPIWTGFNEIRNRKPYETVLILLNGPLQLNIRLKRSDLFPCIHRLNNRVSMVSIHFRLRTPTEIVYPHVTLVVKQAALNKCFFKQCVLSNECDKKALQGNSQRTHSCKATCEPRKTRTLDM